MIACDFVLVFVWLSSLFVLRRNNLWGCWSQKRHQAVGFPCNRMLKLSSSRGIRIDVPVLSVSWSFEDHSVIIQALRKGLIEREASDTGGVPRWKSSCPDRLAEATGRNFHRHAISSVLRDFVKVGSVGNACRLPRVSLEVGNRPSLGRSRVGRSANHRVGLPVRMFRN